MYKWLVIVVISLLLLFSSCCGSFGVFGWFIRKHIKTDKKIRIKTYQQVRGLPSLVPRAHPRRNRGHLRSTRYPLSSASPFPLPRAKTRTMITSSVRKGGKERMKEDVRWGWIGASCVRALSGRVLLWPLRRWRSGCLQGPRVWGRWPKRPCTPRWLGVSFLPRAHLIRNK
jgi:hypothetical protein